MGDALKQMTLGEDFPEIREAVGRICDDFPGEYWREMDAKSAYPEAFVSILTESGWLSALIPESYGGSGLPLRAAAVILETIHASGGSAAACHAQMYTMGTVLKSPRRTVLIYRLKCRIRSDSLAQTVMATPMPGPQRRRGPRYSAKNRHPPVGTFHPVKILRSSRR